MYTKGLSKNGYLVQSFENLILRQATENDLEFVIEGIIESEKSGGNIIGTCKIFGISEDEYKNILREILHENVGDYEYSLSGFLIVENKDEYIGISGSWIEQLGGISSGIMKSSIFADYLSKDNYDKLEHNIKLIESISIHREPFAFQLEHIYLRNNFRRLGLFSFLIKENIKRNLSRYPFTKVQTILFRGNAASYYAHLKFGFNISELKITHDNDIFKYFPYNSKVLMELDSEIIHRL